MTRLPHRRSRWMSTSAALAATVLVGGVVAGVPVAAAPSVGSSATPEVVANPRVGPPTTVTRLRSSGFGASEAVDVYVDTVARGLAVTTAAGTLSVTVRIPASAGPGKHWITEVGRRSGKAAQTVFTVRTDWAQQGAGPFHRGNNPYENTLSTATARRLDQNWAFRTRGYAVSSPIVANGLVYAGSNSNFYALNAHSGARVWSVRFGVLSSPAVAYGLVYITSAGDDTVYALNARTGATVWSYTTGGFVFGSPTVADGRVYFGSYDHKIYALEARTGAPIWSYTTSGFVLSSPAVADGVVFVGTGGGYILALDAGTGETVWSYATGGPVVSSPAVANGLVYIATIGTDGTVYALNATSGNEIGSGSVAWTQDVGAEVVGSPAVADGVVYVGSRHDLYALDAGTGARLWSVPVAGTLSSPAVANGVVYIGSADANVYAFAADTGARLWSYATGGLVTGGIDASPAVANGLLYIGSNDSTLRAFGLAGGHARNPTRPDPSRLHVTA